MSDVIKNNQDQNLTNQNTNVNTSDVYNKSLLFDVKNFGKVVQVKDGVAFVVNLKNVTFGELVLFVPSPARLKEHKQKTNQP